MTRFSLSAALSRIMDGGKCKAEGSAPAFVGELDGVYFFSNGVIAPADDELNLSLDMRRRGAATCRQPWWRGCRCHPTKPAPKAATRTSSTSACPLARSRNTATWASPTLRVMAAIMPGVRFSRKIAMTGRTTSMPMALGAPATTSPITSVLQSMMWW